MKQSTFRSVFAVIFITMSVVAFFFGWWVTRNVREEARRTDVQLKSVAWAIMSYSAATGSMPTSKDAFTGFITAHPESLSAPRRAGEWPATIEAAEATANPADIAAAVSGRIEVIWPPTGNLAPVIQVRGQPSGNGMIELVNEWLQKWNHGAGATGSK